MEKHMSHLDPSSSKLPLLNQEFQPSVTRHHLNGDKEKDRESATCHLCAIEVPRRFINEHYKSHKHKINTKIADVALERVQKLLQHNIVSDVDKPESLYFCSPCVIALNPKDRETHEKTVMHKKALTVDKLLYDFYVLYANDDRNSDNERESEAAVVQTNDIVPVNETDIPVNIVKNQLMSISEKIEIKTDNVENTNKNVIVSAFLKNNTINNHIKVENTPSTSTNEVDYSQFCTFGNNKNQIFCKSCKVYIPNKISNLLSHQRGFKHKEVLRKIKKQSLISTINISNDKT